jgi:hypothetical protein
VPSKCFHYSGGFDSKESSNSEPITSPETETKQKPKTFVELKELFIKKKGIKKYWSAPVVKGIKNDIDLL